MKIKKTAIFFMLVLFENKSLVAYVSFLNI